LKFSTVFSLYLNSRISSSLCNSNFGYLSTPLLIQSSCSNEQSTWAKTILLSFNSSAAFSKSDWTSIFIKIFNIQSIKKNFFIFNISLIF